MMTGKPKCLCEGSTRLIFSCSGAADVGALADQAVRKISAEGVASMYCLAGLGGKVPGIVATTRAADEILAVDGCPLDCARKTLQEAGIENFGHLRITDMGFSKGSSPVTAESVEILCAQLRKKIQGELV